MFNGRVLIVENTSLAPNYYRMTVSAPEIATLAKPGQFIQFRVAGNDSNDPLLPRPISIYQIKTLSGNISVIYKVVGRGTEILAAKKAGELLEVIGPIGNGFSIPTGIEKMALIAGGVGMPPLFCLAESLKKEYLNLELTLFYGGRSGRDILEWDNWTKIGVEIHTATEDGTLGTRGLVTGLFLEEHRQAGFQYLVACGPQPMLQAVQKIAIAENIPGLLSLEANMACGVGACLGCTCSTTKGYRRVCVDGPVFDLKEVVW